ncbi:MAG TPA: Uma2 family endonuclease [Bryobacteraceae bacterium]|nr:Uma2 family endonuclease [Bryobacteraceae bacterium]
MTAPVTPLTIDDFERLPDELAYYHELVDGELVDVSGNTPNHNGLRDLLIVMLFPYVREQKLGRVLSEQEYQFDKNAHGPDVTFVVAAKTALFDGKKRVQRFVPDLAIEIVSQNDTFEDLVGKARRYRKCGTREVWIFSIESREAYVYSENGRAILDEDGLFESSLIPGFSIRLGDLFDQL